ncbi:MAG: hypothetical protein JKX80_00275 [Candidatus Pacebacteria bacterium]|nr:hypothetical protein [Candidatus Paceibacterota bacterium]
MTHTRKIAMAFVATMMFVLAFITLGTQSAAAQQAFDVPSARDDRGGDRPARIAPIRELNQRAKDARQEVRGDIRDARENRDEFRYDVREKRDEFRNRAVETRSDFREEAQGERGEIRDDAKIRRDEIKAELDAADTPEARKEILKAARKERDEMRKDALEKREEFRGRAKDLRSDLKEHRKEFRSEIKTEVGQRIKAHLEGILNRVSNALEKFTDILDRVNNKLAELEANGVDTTDATRAAAIAEQAIQDASSTLADARTVFERALASDNPREFIDEMKAAVRTATEAVKDAHKALKDALKELRELIRSNNDADNDGDSLPNDGA